MLVDHFSSKAGKTAHGAKERIVVMAIFRCNWSSLMHRPTGAIGVQSLLHPYNSAFCVTSDSGFWAIITSNGSPYATGPLSCLSCL